MPTEEELARLAIKAEDLVKFWKTDVKTVPSWLFNHFISGKLTICEDTVYHEEGALKKDDWIIQGYDGNLIYCPNETFERIREMLREKAKKEMLKDEKPTSGRYPWVEDEREE